MLRLVHDYVSQDTVETLENLLRDARDGQVSGVVFVAMKKGRRFTLATTGSAAKDPVTVLGPALVAIADLVHGSLHKSGSNGHSNGNSS